jgi:hypothetical protein
MNLPNDGHGLVRRLEDIEDAIEKKNPHPSGSLEQIEAFIPDFFKHLQHVYKHSRRGNFLKFRERWKEEKKGEGKE